MGRAAEVEQRQPANAPVPLHQTKTGKAAIWAGRRWWQHRMPLLPVNAAAATLVGGIAIHGAQPAESMWALGLLGAVEAGVGIGHWELRRRNGRALNRKQTVYNLSCGMFVFGYEAAATAFNPASMPMVRALLAGFVAGGACWWLRSAAADSAPDEPAAPAAPSDGGQPQPEEPTPGPDRIWAKRLAAAGGKLPGSALTDIGQIIDTNGAPNGWSATLELNPGDKLITLKASDVANCIEQISEAFDTKPAKMAFIPRSSGRLDLKVFERHPLMRDIYVPETDAVPYQWAQPIGLTVVDEWVMHQLFDPDYGAWHGTFIGSTGSGKSEAMCTVMDAERRIVTEHGDPLVAHVLLDPHEGVSFPGWAEKVSLFASDPADILTVLFALNQEKQNRLERMARYGWKVWRPSPEDPIISVKIDEFVTVATKRPGLIPVAKEAVGEWRKVAMSLSAGARYPGADNFGGDMDLRDGLMGYTWLGRTGNRFSGMIVSNGRSVGDPALIPTHFENGKTTGGLSFWLGSTADASVMMRSARSNPDNLNRGRFGRTSLTMAAVSALREAATGQPSPTPSVTSTSDTPAADPGPSTLWDRIRLFLAEFGAEATTGQICDGLGHSKDKLGAVSQACSRAEANGHLIKTGHGSWVLPEHAPLATAGAR